MLKTELYEIITNGENSGVEFKRDDVRPEQLAKEVVALANLQGGRILLGVEDDGSITGLSRPNAQEWVLNVFRDKIHPQIIPFYEEIVIDPLKRVGVITLSQAPFKPYVVRHNQREDCYIRMGNRSEFATRDQQKRLFQSGGMLHMESLPVPGTSIKNLDLDRVAFYLESIINEPHPPENESDWTQKLSSLGFMTDDQFNNQVCTIAGLLLFGVQPKKYLGQAGLRVMVFEGTIMDYQAQLDVYLDKPLVGRWTFGTMGEKLLMDEGLIESFTTLIYPYISTEAGTVDQQFRKERLWRFPLEAVREGLINALVHRDWTRTVDVEVVVYQDRMEITSPGGLHNSMTIEKMKAGQRHPRNNNIVNTMRDYGYVDARGMGVRTKMIPLMKQHNGIEPVFELTEDYLKTILYRKHSN